MAGAIPGGFNAARAPGFWHRAEPGTAVLPANFAPWRQVLALGRDTPRALQNGRVSSRFEYFLHSGAVLAKRQRPRDIPLNPGLELNGF